MKHHVACVNADKIHRGVCRDSQGEALTHLGPEPEPERSHHIYCAMTNKSHTGACQDAAGMALPTITGPNLSRLVDQPLDKVPFGYSATGIPVHAIASIPRPLNFGLDPDGHPANFQTEQYFRHVGSLKPLVSDEVLATVDLKGDDGYRPDHPRVEVNYADPSGLTINMTIETPSDIAEYYDADMALSMASRAVQRVMTDVGRAKRQSELRPIDGEPTDG